MVDGTLVTCLYLGRPCRRTAAVLPVPHIVQKRRKVDHLQIIALQAQRILLSALLEFKCRV